jgi:NAD(P)-dependent dehydrogenase (short-subunit alcohol dehydrogenase family)
MMTRKSPPSVKLRPRALVTGGAIRVGRAIALALAGAGMDVAISYHHSGAAAARTVRDIERLGVRGVAFHADLGGARTPRRLVAATVRALGGLDVLVNNAAVFPRTPLASTPAATFDAVLAVNVRVPFLCAQAAADVMPRGGHIVNIGDVGAHAAWPGYLAYTVSKAGVIALTRGLAAALAPRAISVNCVSPGRVLRPTGFSRARWAKLTRGRAETVDDVAAAVLAFATCPPTRTGRVVNVER